MIIKYSEFKHKLNEKIKSDADFYYELVTTVLENPNRYTGIFRVSNAKTKLIQNVTQSREIKFGDFMEDIVTQYISLIGYENLDKIIGTDNEGNALSADQVFTKGNTVYLIEQKIRDDHDSTKKRGQYENFKKKYDLLQKKFPQKSIDATMWFIDDSLCKNRRYYTDTAIEDNKNKVAKHILYGGDLFKEIFKRIDVWDEICNHLSTNKKERTDEILEIPDFDTSKEILDALKKIKAENPNLIRKLLSDKPQYQQLRFELFNTNYNLSKI